LRHIFFEQVQGTVPFDREIKEYVPVKDNWFLSMDAIRSFICKDILNFKILIISTNKTQDRILFAVDESEFCNPLRRSVYSAKNSSNRSTIVIASRRESGVYRSNAAMGF
jgi:hypothetical protein